MSAMHRHATEKADFLFEVSKTPLRVDRLLKQQAEWGKNNKEVLHVIVLAVEFLAKQELVCRGNNEDKILFF